ncbi:MAG: hypothetical protein HY678_04880 [Chloroflexi bacterium]|nr:hypothetical protein [Chloroflexota bacterium]
MTNKVVRAAVRGSVDEVSKLPPFDGNEDSAPLTCRNMGVRKALIPIKGVTLLSHGPRTCSFRQRVGLRNENSALYFTTDLTEAEVISGGRDKLHKAIAAIDAKFHPKLIAVMNSCPTALNGDDIHAAARYMDERVEAKVRAVDAAGIDGKVHTFGVEAGGILLVEEIMKEQPEIIPTSINLWGYYTVANEAEVKGGVFETLERMGVRIVNVFTAGASCDAIEKASAASLNVIICATTSYRPVVRMQERFGTPFINIEAPLGIENTREGLLQIADALGLPQSARDVVEEEAAHARSELAKVRPYLQGKKVALFAGGGKGPAWLGTIAEAGMDVKVMSLCKVRDYLVPESVPVCGSSFDKIRKTTEKYGLEDMELVLNPGDFETKKIVSEQRYDLYLNCISRRKIGWQTHTMHHNAMDQADLARGFSGTLQLFKQWAGLFRGEFARKYGEFLHDDLELLRPEAESV